MTFDRPGMTLRLITADELPDFARFVSEVFLGDYHDEELDLDRDLIEWQRSLAVFDGSDLVATTAAFTRELTVPGGPIAAAAVSAVGVSPTHRRRGLLTAMMREQIDDLHEQQREAVAVLWASEGGIYGRFGYGVASSGSRLEIATAQTRIRPEVERAGDVRLCTLDEAMPAMQAVYEAVRPDRVGHLGRPGRWWEARVFDPQWRREGASALRFAVHDGEDGAPDAYAMYAPKPTWDATGPQGEIGIREVQASTPGGYAAIWGFLLELDLVRRVRWGMAAPDEPLHFLVDNPRAVQQTSLDSLWVRLVDVPRALSLRTYATSIDVVLEVDDAYCPWNAGRFRLRSGAAGAQCEPTADAADLALGAAALGSAYLGGTSLATLAAAGQVAELRAGALAAATPAFSTPRPPSCPEVF